MRNDPSVELLQISRCHDLNEDADCPLRSNDWSAFKWCPKCGRPNGAIGVGRNGFPSVAAGLDKTVWIPLDIAGTHKVKYEASVATSGVTVKKESRRGQDGLLLEFKSHFTENETREIDARITTWNGPRDLTKLNKTDFPLEPKFPSRITITASKAKLASSLATLILHERTTERSFDVWIEGAVPLEVDIQASGFGFDLLQLGVPQAHLSERLAPKGKITCSVRCRNGQNPSGAVVISAPSCEPINLKVLWVTENVAEPSAAPYTVGIDFGTSGTSLNVIENGEPFELVKAIAAKGETQGDEFFRRYRWPTLIAVKDSDRNGWFWGLEAEPKTQDPDFGYISDLKTRMRQNRPIVFEDPDNSELRVVYSAVEVAAWYFRQIRNHLERNIPDIYRRVQLGQPIDVFFSLPVLDYNEEEPKDFLTQREATLDAAKRAFTSPYQVHTIFEPEAAACYLVQLAGAGMLKAVDPFGVERNISVASGETIMVYDSGGGTTDIIVGTLKITPGKASLDLHLCARGVSEEREGYDGSLYPDFAGRAVNDYYLQQFHNQTRESKEEADLKSAIYDAEKLTFGGDPVEEFDDAVREQRFSWATGRSPLASEFEASKIRSSQTGALIRMRNDDRLTINREFLDRFKSSGDATSQVNQIVSILDSMKARNQTISKVILVGGNSELRPLQEAIYEKIIDSDTEIVIPRFQIEDKNAPISQVVPRGVCLGNLVPRHLRPYTLKVVEVKPQNSAYAPQVALFPAGEVGESKKAMVFATKQEIQLVARLPVVGDVVVASLRAPEGFDWNRSEVEFSMQGLNLHVIWQARGKPPVTEDVYIA